MLWSVIGRMENTWLYTWLLARSLALFAFACPSVRGRRRARSEEVRALRLVVSLRAPVLSARVSCRRSQVYVHGEGCESVASLVVADAACSTVKEAGHLLLPRWLARVAPVYSGGGGKSDVHWRESSYRLLLAPVRGSPAFADPLHTMVLDQLLLCRDSPSRVSRPPTRAVRETNKQQQEITARTTSAGTIG